MHVMNEQRVEVMYVVVLSTASVRVPPLSRVLLSSSQYLCNTHLRLVLSPDPTP